LHDHVAAEARDALRGRVSQDREVARITLIEAARALAEFAAAASMEAEAFGGDNPLPDVLEVEVERATWQRDRGVALAERLQREPLVAAVYRAGDWVERLDVLLTFGRRLLWMVGLVIGVGVLLLVGTVVGGLVDRCVDEIEVRALVGATAGFIRRPFLYAGAGCGLAGAALASALLALAMIALSGGAERVVEAYGGNEPVALSMFAVSIGLGLSGLALGYGGAWLGCSVNLRRFEAHLD
jgi:cell division transport system permease protein